MDKQPIDTKPAPADPGARMRSVRQGDEILVYVCGRPRPNGASSDAVWYLTTACDLADCLDLARSLEGLGVVAISFGALFAGGFPRIEWKWRRQSKRRSSKAYARHHGGIGDEFKAPEDEGGGR